MRPSLAPQPALHVRVVPPERLLLLAEALQVPDALLERPTAPEEELEEELAPEALVARVADSTRQAPMSSYQSSGCRSMKSRRVSAARLPS